MRKWCAVLFCLCYLFVYAQYPTDFRTEQIFLNLNKHNYQPGDTIQLEGMVTCLAADRFLPYSNYLYIECFNDQDSVLIRQKVSCKEKGYFYTQILTDYVWPAGVYYLRAYTQLMRNFSLESFAQQPFLLAKVFPKKEKQPYEAKCTIVPSGGKLVADYPQTITVFLADECTFPISDKLQLMSEKNDTLGLVHTSASGMAQLSFIPTYGMKYYLTGNIEGRQYHFPLPEVTRDIKIQGSLNGNRLNFQMLNVREDGTILYTYDRLNGLTCTNVERDNGILMLKESPEVLTLFLADKNNRILSECTLGSKQKRNGKMQVPDTIGLNESIHYELPQLSADSKVMARIVAENDLLAASAESFLKYFSDYTSPLPFPRHLYAADESEFNNDLQAWLATSRFHRFNLKEVLAKDTLVYVYSPEQVMTFGGRIDKKNGRPLKGGQLVAYHKTNDYVYDVPLLGDSARFLMAVDDYMDGDEFFLQAITPKEKPDFADYLLDEESYPPLRNYRHFSLPVSRYADTEVIIGDTFNLNYSIDKNNERNYTLPNVTVKARLRTEKVKDTKEFYANSFADREKIERKAYLTLADILRDMAGIKIGKYLVTVADPSGTSAHEEWLWIIESTRGISLLGGNAPLPIILDGFREDNYDIVMEMPASDIESVEVLRAWQTLAYTSGAINGAILVKTINYRKREPLPSKGAVYIPLGLSPLSHPYCEFTQRTLQAEQPGRFRLLVDVFTNDGIRSFEHPFVVVGEDFSATDSF